MSSLSGVSDLPAGHGLSGLIGALLSHPDRPDPGALPAPVADGPEPEAAPPAPAGATPASSPAPPAWAPRRHGRLSRRF